MFLTAVAVCMLGGIALYSKVEFMTSKYFAYLLMGHLVMNILGLIFFGFNSMIYGFFSSILFSVYLIIDIQMLMDNKQVQLGVADYVCAPIIIYMDII